MTPHEYSKAQVATACWRAAKDELPNVMLSVCQVFMNRSDAGGGDLYEEVTKWLVEHPGDFPDTRDPQFQQMLSKLDTVTSKLAADRTGGALWFVPKSELKPDMLRAFQITTTMGGLVFIK